MSKKLFIGCLNYSTDNERLREGFAPFGEVVEAAVVTDRDTGRSRGFGFVTFSDPTAGTKAITEMDGQQFDGFTIRVSEAKERAPRVPFAQDPGSFRTGAPSKAPRSKGKSRRGDRSERW